jgi:hypothetical protein
MPAENRYLSFGLMLGVLGMGIGVGLAIASFIVGVGSSMGAALSSSGTFTIIAFVVLTVVLSVAVRRQKRVGGRT